MNKFKYKYMITNDVSCLRDLIHIEQDAEENHGIFLYSNVSMDSCSPAKSCLLEVHFNKTNTYTVF